MKKIKSLALVACLSVSFFSHAGIPVAVDADPLRDAQWAQDWAQKIKEWTDTAQHYKSQIQAYQDQLATATGIREIAAFTNDLKNLQSELTDVYKKGDAFVGDLTKNPTAMLSNEALSLFNKYGAFNMCKTGVISSDNLCKAKVINNAASIERGTDISMQLAKSMDKIQELSGRLENSKDIKESQDLANSLQAQSLKMQAIKMQYDVWSNKNKADAEMFNTQEKAAFREQQKNAPVLTFN